MKKWYLVVFCVLFSGLLFAADSKKVGYDTSNIFAGAELGLADMALLISVPSVGINTILNRNGSSQVLDMA